jgi:hypothetical protein
MDNKRHRLAGVREHRQYAIRHQYRTIIADQIHVTTAAWRFECAIEKALSCGPHKAALSPIIRPTGVGRIGHAAPQHLTFLSTWNV